MYQTQRWMIIILTAASLLVLWREKDVSAATSVIAISQQVGGTGTVQSISHTPAINDVGNIAYVAYLKNQGYSLFLSNGNSSTQLIAPGDPAPDGNGSFGFLGDAVLTNQDEIVLEAFMTDTAGGFNDAGGIFRVAAHGVEQLVREGQLEPDGNFNFDSFYTRRVNDVGQVLFASTLKQNFRKGVYLSEGAEIHEIARSDKLSPDGLSEFGLTGNIALNNLGQFAFHSNDHLGFNEGPYERIYIGSGSSLTEVVRTGDSVPGTARQFAYFSGGLALNDAGAMIFRADLADDGTGGMPTGIFYWSDGVIQPIVEVGDPIPSGSGAFDAISGVSSLNTDGQTVFWGSFTDNSQTPVEHSGLFLGSTNGVVEIARDDQAAPDGNGNIGSVFSGPTELTAVNDSGQFVFSTRSSFSADDIAAYLFDGSQLVTVARIGQPMLNSTLAKITSQSSREAFSLNSHGQVVYQFELADGRTGIALYTRDDPFAPGDFNKDGNVDAADYTVWRDGYGTTYTADDYLVWKEHFGATSGIGARQVDQSVSVPEPREIVTILVGCGLFRLLLFRRSNSKREIVRAAYSRLDRACPYAATVR